MKRSRVALAIVGACLTGVAVFRVTVLPEFVIRQMLPDVPGDARTPADVDLPYEDASFFVEGDRLVAWFVEPPEAKPLAFLLLHGDGAPISVFIQVQKLLYDAGYASFTFDYGGFGHSEGEHSSRILREEPRAALDELRTRVDRDTRIVLLGHSFGSAVAVEAFHDQDIPDLHSVIFIAGPPSLREVLHEGLGVPGPVTWLVPNMVNAKQHIADFHVPVLVVATETDEVAPFELVVRVFEGATEPKELLLYDGAHSDLYDGDPIWWAPILGWLERM